MATNSTLSPALPYPADDDALDAIFQSLIVSVTGLDGSLVRPRWQPTVPKQPEASVNWCAIGVVNEPPDQGAYFDFDQSSETGLYIRHEDIFTLASFYGPNSKQYAALVRDGLAVPQNCEGLRQYDIGFIETGAVRSVPDLVNQQWIRRRDMSIHFRRKITRTYELAAIVAAEVHLIDDTVLNDLIVVPPGTSFLP